MIKVTLYNHDAMRSKFRQLDQLQLLVFDPVMGAWANETDNYLKGKKYPPELPNQDYRRTGILKARWFVVKLSPGKYQFENRARQKGRFYPIYVLGNEYGDRRNAVKNNRQALIHKGRWWVAFDEIEKRMNELNLKLEAGIQDIWN